MRRFTQPAWVSLPLRLAAANFLSNCAVETSNVFLPLYAREVGASNLQVGFIAAATGIAFLVASLLFGRLSDSLGRTRFIRAGFGLSALAYLTQLLAGGPWALLAARAFVGFSTGINASVIMAYTYEHQKQIGKFISYGALGWLVGAMLAAVIRGYHAMFIISAVSVSLAFAVSFLLREETTRRVPAAVLPLALIKDDYRIYLAFFLRQLGGTAIWTVWPLYLSSLGASRTWIAVMDGMNMVGQFVAMRLVERYNPARLFQMGLLVSSLSFVIYALATNYLQILPVQLLIAVSWAGLMIGSLSYLLRRNSERGTVSGLLNATLSSSGSLGPFLGGTVSQAYGYVAVMYVGASISFVAFLTALGLKPRRAAGAVESHAADPLIYQ